MMDVHLQISSTYGPRVEYKEKKKDMAGLRQLTAYLFSHLINGEKKKSRKQILKLKISNSIYKGASNLFPRMYQSGSTLQNDWIFSSCSRKPFTWLLWGGLQAAKRE